MRAFSKFLTGLLIASTLGLQAQSPKKANHWYFGNFAGLDFSSGRPISVSNSGMAAMEGTTSISNANGNLLFYSNGGSLPNAGAIWNKNHQVMLNGDLTNTRGCASSFQNSIALPLPGNSNTFYLFATDCRENGLVNGLSYHVIDMNLDGGLGGVVQKDVPLVGFTNETITAARHANGKDYWVITSIANTDSIYAFQLSRNGITAVVKSATGHIASEDAGEIKVSANGQRLVFAGGSGATYLYKFDSNTGVVSQGKNLNLGFGFAASFSNDCRYLYATDFNFRKIYQYDVLSHNLLASKIEVGTSNSLIGAMQNGPDGRIYVARRNTPFLGVIENPELKGTASSYVDNGVSLGSNNSRFGLPNFSNDVIGECQHFNDENVSRFDFALHPGFINTNNITLNWNPFNITEFTLFKIGVTELETGNYTEYEVEGSELDVVGLNSDTEYKFELKQIIYENAIYEPFSVGSFDSDGEAITSVKVKTLNDMQFNVYPNPTKTKTNITFNHGENTADVELQIVDLSGKAVYVKTFDKVSGFKDFEISLQGLPSGVYNLSITSEFVKGNKRLVVLN